MLHLVPGLPRPEMLRVADLLSTIAAEIMKGEPRDEFIFLKIVEEQDA